MRMQWYASLLPLLCSFSISATAGSYTCYLNFQNEDNPYEYPSTSSSAVHRYPSIRVPLQRASAAFNDFKGWRKILFSGNFDDQKHDQRQLIRDFAIFESQIQKQSASIFHAIEDDESLSTFVAQFRQAFEDLQHGPEDIKGPRKSSDSHLLVEAIKEREGLYRGLYAEFEVALLVHLMKDSSLSLYWLKRILKKQLKRRPPHISLPDRFDIDVVFEYNQKLVFGEIKHKIRPLRCRASLLQKIRDLRKSTQLFNQSIQVAIFSRSGITPECKEQLENDGVLVFARVVRSSKIR